ARNLWVWGGGDAGWRADDQQTFELLTDKPLYRPGDTARIVAKTPIGKAQALLTMEREGVLERRLFTLDPEHPAIEVPIRDAHTPNVYVSLVLVKGRSGAGPRGRPILRMGLVNLPVEAEPRRLKVAIATDREAYQPGDPVKVELSVRDAAGQPV